MPNRILKETVCTSENVDILSAEAERFFYRLMVQCDDYGRMDARVPVLRARCFPLKLDVICDDNIRAWLAELIQADLIRIYTSGGRPYLYFSTWERHQQIRAKKSKFPAPPAEVGKPEGMISDDINGYQAISDVPENPIQSKENTTPDNVFVVFQHEIGVITKAVGDELVAAEKDYPAGWLVEAIQTAAKANKRSWNYIKGILNNWQVEGKSPPKPNGKHRTGETVEIDLPFGEVSEAKL